MIGSENQITAIINLILYAKCMSAQSGNPDLSCTLSPLIKYRSNNVDPEQTVPIGAV